MTLSENAQPRAGTWQGPDRCEPSRAQTPAPCGEIAQKVLALEALNRRWIPEPAKAGNGGVHLDPWHSLVSQPSQTGKFQARQERPVSKVKKKKKKKNSVCLNEKNQKKN